MTEIPTYTAGITKVLSLPSMHARNLDHAAKIARDCGYKLFAFNGDIYLRTGPGMTDSIQTPLTLEDFRAS